MLEIARRQASAQLEPRRRELQRAIAAIRSDYIGRGMLDSGAFIEATLDALVKEIALRGQLFWSVTSNALLTGGVRWSEDLADALKRAVRAVLHFGDVGAEANMLARTGVDTEAELASRIDREKARVLRALDAEVDLLALRVQREAMKATPTNAASNVFNIENAGAVVTGSGASVAVAQGSAPAGPRTHPAAEDPRAASAPDAVRREEPGMTAPKAFFCHSTADKATIGDRLAADLRAAGIDVWYDKFEIRGGDSLRRKIDEGIEGATHFLALLTPNSLRSEWVQTELDAAMVKKIEGTCRLVPILAGVTVADLPVTLRGIKCVPFESYEAGLREVVGLCHEVSTKPPLGPPPAWASERPLPKTMLSPNAQRLAAFLNERSQYALGSMASGDPALTDEHVMGALGMTEDELAVAADELDSIGWVELLKAIAVGQTGFTYISPKPLLFIETDPSLKGWYPRQDAKALAAAMVNARADFVDLETADKVLLWGPRRINAAAHCLHHNGHAQRVGGHTAGGYAYYGFHVTTKTKRLAREA